MDESKEVKEIRKEGHRFIVILMGSITMAYLLGMYVGILLQTKGLP